MERNLGVASCYDLSVCSRSDSGQRSERRRADRCKQNPDDSTSHSALLAVRSDVVMAHLYVRSVRNTISGRSRARRGEQFKTIACHSAPGHFTRIGKSLPGDVAGPHSLRTDPTSLTETHVDDA